MEEELDKLIKYVIKKYKEPELWWPKEKYRKRCIEIYATDQAILKCLDLPFKEPKVVIENYIYELCISNKYNDSTKSDKYILIMLNTLYSIYRFLN